MLKLAVNNTRVPPPASKGSNKDSGPGLRREEHADLFMWWQRERGNAPYVDRSRVEPRDFAAHMPWMMVVGNATTTAKPDCLEPVWRFAGSNLCWLFNRRLLDGPFNRFWSGASRRRAMSILAKAEASPRPFCLHFKSADLGIGTQSEFEMLALPMIAKTGSYIHFIGSIRPVAALSDLSPEGYGEATLLSQDAPRPMLTPLLGGYLS